VVEAIPRPQKPKTHFRFFFFGLLGVAGPPPWPWGWFDHPQTGSEGGWIWPKMGWSGHPILAPPQIFFSFFYLLLLLFYFYNLINS
jgi:hypothetical protein